MNDSLLLAKSSLDINLLPENEDDRNMASLLSLRPSRSIEESQTQTRSKILNTPALTSSTHLLTSFGGLKKEELLSKSAPLTRNSLGITIKRSKTEGLKGSPENKDNAENIAVKDIFLDEKVKDNVKMKDISEIKDQKEMKVEEKVNLSSQLSLVGDYSSSEDSS